MGARLTDEQLDMIEEQSSSSSGDYGRNEHLLALVAEVRAHRAKEPEPMSDLDKKAQDIRDRLTSWIVERAGLIAVEESEMSYFVVKDRWGNWPRTLIATEFMNLLDTRSDVRSELIVVIPKLAFAHNDEEG